MSTKFFTNDGSNTLLNKLEGIFQHMDVHFFDAVIDYFRASGYFRIYKFLRDVEEIRFLVGINVDKLTYDANSRGLEVRPCGHPSLKGRRGILLTRESLFV